MSKKPWNTTMDIDMDIIKIREFTDWYTSCLTNTKFVKSKANNNPINDDVVDYLKSIYCEGYGLKVIARKLNITYTKLRSVFEYLNIDIRKGYDVVTDKVKEFRSERVSGVNNPWSDIECRKNVNCNGIQGYYSSKCHGLIWLRSTWEYIYAKWLDKANINWRYESKQFILSDGSSYRPDFFIYDENDKLNYVVEVKGYIKDKLYKVQLLRDEYKIHVVVVDDIEDYTEFKYEKELKLWKQVRK